MIGHTSRVAAKERRRECERDLVLEEIASFWDDLGLRFHGVWMRESDYDLVPGGPRGHKGWEGQSLQLHSEVGWRIPSCSGEVGLLFSQAFA